MGAVGGLRGLKETVAGKSFFFFLGENSENNPEHTNLLLFSYLKHLEINCDINIAVCQKRVLSSVKLFFRSFFCVSVCVYEAVLSDTEGAVTECFKS